MNSEKELKLILLNGPPGIGKSTLSQRYVDEHPMCLNLDIDKVWWMMGQWQRERSRSEEQKMILSLALTRAHLKQGFSVMASQDVIEDSHYLQFQQIAQECGAKIVEVTLVCPIDEAIQRCINRGIRRGYPNGFRPGGILESEGGSEKLRRMYTEMMAVVSTRTEMQYIHSVEGREQDAYEQLLNVTR